MECSAGDVLGTRRLVQVAEHSVEIHLRRAVRAQAGGLAAVAELSVIFRKPIVGGSGIAGGRRGGSILRGLIDAAEIGGHAGFRPFLQRRYA